MCNQLFSKKLPYFYLSLCAKIRKSFSRKDLLEFKIFKKFFIFYVAERVEL